MASATSRSLFSLESHFFPNNGDNQECTRIINRNKEMALATKDWATSAVMDPLVLEQVKEEQDYDEALQRIERYEGHPELLSCLDNELRQMVSD